MYKKVMTVASVIIAMMLIVTCMKSNANGADAGYKVTGVVKPEFINLNYAATSQLAGFNVIVEGTQASCQTDSEGRFELNNVQRGTGYTIKISKPGYLTRIIHNIAVSGDTALSISGLPIDIWAGDFNDDTAINMADIIDFAKVFNLTSSSDKYNPVFDLNKDEAINMSDVMIVIRHFNKTSNDYLQNITIISNTPTNTPTHTPTYTPTKAPTPTPTASMSGKVTYTLVRASSPTADQLAAYEAITAAMDKAVSYYNRYTNITLNLRVLYEPSVATADANINGTIRFGKREYMNHITAMHEIAHTAGVGTTQQYRALIVNGVFTGVNATNQLRAITGNPQDVLKGDSQHFWPYGLNYTSEVKSEDDLINHCKIVNAIRKDLGF
ncbi:MAG TPA: carboxypeptidase-like regulatory domain-containing protein [Pseudobacteroides sp.]|nr:carboxypeptidase-like regulatory domain-containing protein [Pseudobacteroides sp.]